MNHLSNQSTISLDFNEWFRVNHNLKLMSANCENLKIQNSQLKLKNQEFVRSLHECKLSTNEDILRLQMQLSNLQRENNLLKRDNRLLHSICYNQQTRMNQQHYELNLVRHLPIAVATALPTGGQESFISSFSSEETVSERKEEEKEEKENKKEEDDEKEKEEELLTQARHKIKNLSKLLKSTHSQFFDKSNRWKLNREKFTKEEEKNVNHLLLEASKVFQSVLAPEGKLYSFRKQLLNLLETLLKHYTIIEDVVQNYHNSKYYEK